MIELTNKVTVHRNASGFITHYDPPINLLVTQSLYVETVYGADGIVKTRLFVLEEHETDNDVPEL